jgi:hypothetical protein
MSLSIPFTQTTALYTDPNAASFPAEVGAQTPYSSGYLTVANASAYVSIFKGDGRGGGSWGPDFPITGSPNAIVPLLAGQRQFIFGVRARDGVAGTHALVSGALFQPGEATVTPSATFAGTVSTSGGFTPPPVMTAGTILASGIFGGNVSTSNATFAGGVDVLATPLTLAADGVSNYLVTFYTYEMDTGAATNSSVLAINLDGAAAALMVAGNALVNGSPVYAQGYLTTPTAGNHTVNVRAWSGVGGNTTELQGGNGTAGVGTPMIVTIVQL